MKISVTGRKEKILHPHKCFRKRVYKADHRNETSQTIVKQFFHQATVTYMTLKQESSTKGNFS